MQHNGWVKCFTDGTEEYGYDHLVAARQASWSKGRLARIGSVELRHGQKLMVIEGQGDYWQSDTFECVLLADKSELVTRTLYKQLTFKDKFISLARPSENLIILKTLYSNDIRTYAYFVNLEDVGRWLIVDLDVKSGKMSWRIGDRPWDST